MTETPAPTPDNPEAPEMNEATSPDAKPRKGFPLVPVLLVVLIGLVLGQALIKPDVVHLEDEYWLSDTAAAFAAAEAQDMPVLAVFTADWCPPCQTLKSQVFTDETVRAELPGQVVPLYVDMTERDAPLSGFAQQYGVSGIPTMLLLGSDGEVIDGRQGAMSASDFMAWLETNRPQS